MPFITEEIWQSLPHEAVESIMISAWPVYSNELDFSSAEAEFEKIMDAIKAIRNRRSEMNVPPSKKAKVCIATTSKETFTNGIPFICRLASASAVEIAESFDMSGAVRLVTDAANIYMPMNELIDFTAELDRLNKDLKKANEDKEFFEKKLNNPGFVSKAPEKVLNEQREKLQKTLDRIAMLENSINDIKGQM